MFVLQYQWQDSLSVPPSTQSSMKSTFYQDSAKTKTNVRRMYATPSGSTTLHATTGAWVLGHAVRLYSTAHWMLMSTLDLCLYAVAQRTACISNPQSASFLRFQIAMHCWKRRKSSVMMKKTWSFLPGLYVLFSVHWTYIAEPMMSVNASYKTPLYK